MLTYTLMNLIKSPWRSLQMIFGTYLVFILLISASSFQQGMERSLAITGDDKNVIILGTGSEESLERSEVPFSAYTAAKTIYGLKQTFEKPAVSPEVHYNTLVSVEGRESEAMLRGITAAAIQVYPALAIEQGTFPKSGEMMIGRLAWKRLGFDKESLQIGKIITYEKQEFKISGIFSAPGTVMESEIWLNLNDLSALTQRDTLSCIVVRMDIAEYDDIDLFTKRRLDLQISAIPETVYFAKLGTFYKPIKLMAWITALLIAAGALFGGLNTFYAAIKNRCKELATLQAIGYSRLRLFLSLYGESLFLHFISFQAAVITALYVFPGIHLNFGTTFFSLSVNQKLIFEIFLVCLVLALTVILLPAWNCLRPPLNQVLKD
ncbi:MAG: FtsX-like permease family protein [Lentisphaeraceae bacterium]|nr:FtsX-like permease family protein [Lentisphaeraceae bacterium]